MICTTRTGVWIYNEVWKELLCSHLSHVSTSYADSRLTIQSKSLHSCKSIQQIFSSLNRWNAGLHLKVYHKHVQIKHKWRRQVVLLCNKITHQEKKVKMETVFWIHSWLYEIRLKSKLDCSWIMHSLHHFSYGILIILLLFFEGMHELL